MDIAKIQRVNALAKELLSKGIVSSSDDAFQKAQAMVIGKKQVNDEMEEQFVNELRFLSRKVSEIDRKICSINDDIKCVVEEIVALKSQKAAAPRAEDVKAACSVVKSEPAKRTEAQRELKESSADVSIEKIFYCGKK